jgi:predicted SAM-dependent methyltransferase
MSNEPVRVWMAMDPEHGRLLLVVNRVPVGTLSSVGGQVTINLDPEYAGLRDDLTKYCAGVFANMPDTLRAALYEAPGFMTNTAGRDAMEALAPDRKRRVHLGCGPDVRAGWLNIDYQPGAALGYSTATSFLNYDLRQGLPGLEDGSVEMFFSSHFFEHLRHEEAMNLMQQCRRALRDDGVARFQMPDFKGTFRAYVDDDKAFFDTAVSTHKVLDHMPAYAQNYADLVSRSVYEFYTHKYIWDPDNLAKALGAAGFSDVQVDDYNPELDHPSSIRRDYSYYLVARP